MVGWHHLLNGYESWTVKKAECRRIDAFELWRRLLRVSWTARRSNQSILKEINPEEFPAVQTTLQSRLQHHSLKASVLPCSACFMVQLSHPYMTTGKTIALTRWTFVGKVMSLLFNMLSRLVIAFLPRSKRLNFTAAVTICSDFGAQENKVCHCFHCFPIYLS